LKNYLIKTNYLISGVYIIDIRCSIVLSFVRDHSCGKTLEMALKEGCGGWVLGVKNYLIYEI
jgi:hypothetical protein